MQGPREEITRGIRGEVLEKEPLSRHTSLKVGGPADLFVIPADRDDLVQLIDNLHTAQVPYLVIGGGYNLLVRDKGFRGVAISLWHLATVTASVDGVVYAGAGATNGALVRFCEEERFAGLEFLAGIPGTVGGSLAVNAGADHLDQVIDVTKRAGLSTIPVDGEGLP